MATIKFEAEAVQTLMSTELNSLANGSNKIATNGYANQTNLYMYGIFELNVTWGTNPTAGNLVNLYLIPAVDGTNYDDGSDSINPPLTTYVGGFPVRAVTTAQKIVLGGFGLRSLISLPPLLFKPLLINNSGFAFPASGSTLKMVAYRIQSS